jgi:hypothetical protein
MKCILFNRDVNSQVFPNKITMIVYTYSTNDKFGSQFVFVLDPLGRVQRISTNMVTEWPFLCC